LHPDLPSYCFYLVFYCFVPSHPTSTLFPYTTLFRSTLDSSGTTIKSMQSKSLSGKVSSDGTSFADYDFASDVEILDTDDEGGYADRKSTRLNSSHVSISYAVFCLKKKKEQRAKTTYT